MAATNYFKLVWVALSTTRRMLEFNYAFLVSFKISWIKICLINIFIELIAFN